MSLCYRISPALNLILYVGEGYASPSDFFALEKAAFLEYPRHLGMITLVDALELSTSFDVKDIRRFIDNIDRMTRDRLEPGPYIMITKDWGLHLLADAAKLMAGKVDLKARMYFTLEEAIVALGLSDHEQEIVQLWNECKLESLQVCAWKGSCHLCEIWGHFWSEFLWNENFRLFRNQTGNQRTPIHVDSTCFLNSFLISGGSSFHGRSSSAA